MLRTLTEKLARGVVFRRRLPRAFGRRPFYVTPDAALAYLKPGYDEFRDLLAIAAEQIREGDSVWDIGANVGLFSVLAAHQAGSSGTVISVEADPQLASLIQRTSRLRQNTDRTISVLCAAVCDRSGIQKFSIAERGRASSSLQQTGHRSQAGGTRYVQPVAAVTLDEMLDTFPPPALIKIDVEGAEQLVLQGARSVLEQHRPRLYIEVGPPQADAVTALLRKYGYHLFDGQRPVEEQRPGLRAAFNTLAVPAEQAEDLPVRKAA